MNAVIYARYSSDKQNEQSIDGQLRYCREYAERMGYAVVGEYVDRAMSGTKDNRPEFQRMISDASKKVFQFIIVWKLDRFSRNRYDSAIYKSRLKKFGVRVLSATEGIGENNESIILEAVLEASAEMYSAQLGENAARGMRENALKGLTTGGNIPLGYRIEDKHLVIDEKAAHIVRFIYKLRAEGKTKTEIVNACNERNYKTKTGRSFYTNALHAILTNRMYIGDYTYKGEIARSCPAIIDENTFSDVQQKEAVVKRMKGRKQTDDTTYHLSGKLFCGYCKKPMVGDCGTSQNGETHHYYTCAGRKKRSGCKKKSEKKDFLEWYICEQTVEYVLQPDHMQKIAKGVADAFVKEYNDDRAERLEARLKEIDREIEGILDTLLATKVQAVIDAANKRAEALEYERNDIREELGGVRVLAKHCPDAKDIEKWIRSFKDGDLFDPEFRLRVIESLVNAVYLYDDRILIYYNTNDKQCSVIEENPDDLDFDSTPECSNRLSQGEPGKSTCFRKCFFSYIRLAASDIAFGSDIRRCRVIFASRV